jgi:hypothetical protein
VLKNPDNKSNEKKEKKTAHPKVPCQRFHEDPCIFTIVVCYRNNHGDTTFCERQGVIDVQGPVEDNGHVSNHSIIILFAVNKNAKERNLLASTWMISMQYHKHRISTQKI